MKVQYTRPHVGGSMAGIGVDTKIVSLPDTDAQGNALAVPAGATRVESAAPESDWAWDVPAFGVPAPVSPPAPPAPPVPPALNLAPVPTEEVH